MCWQSNRVKGSYYYSMSENSYFKYFVYFPVIFSYGQLPWQLILCGGSSLAAPFKNEIAVIGSGRPGNTDSTRSPGLSRPEVLAPSLSRSQNEFNICNTLGSCQDLSRHSVSFRLYQREGGRQSGGSALSCR